MIYKINKECPTCNALFKTPPSDFKRRIYCSRKCIKMPSESNHPMWKGKKAGYFAIHMWLYKKLGQPNKCSNCNTTTAKRFEWANISKKYKRDINDWIRLCKKCHQKFDNSTPKGEHNHWAKLKEKDVIKIRKIYKKIYMVIN